MKSNLSNIDISQIGLNSGLKERKKNFSSGTKAKHITSMPIAYFEAHEELKKIGGTSSNFSAYIVEAVRAKLRQDGVI